MISASAKDRRLTGFLLGQLAEPDRIETEERYFADDAAFEYLAAVEMELIDAYVRGDLSAADRLQFEARFLASSRLRARIEFSRQLQARMAPIAGTVTATATATAATAGAPAQATWPGTATVAAKTGSEPAVKRSPSLVGVVAVVVAASGAGVGWWSLQSSSPNIAAAAQDAPAPVTPQPVSLPAPAPAAPLTPAALTPVPAGPVALVLAPGSSGNHDSSGVLTMTPGADPVRIQIDHAGPGRERYAVIVSTRDRQRVWTELNMAPRAAGAKGVILEIPAAALPAGDYLVTLSGGTLQARHLEAVADYTLHVK